MWNLCLFLKSTCLLRVANGFASSTAPSQKGYKIFKLALDCVVLRGGRDESRISSLSQLRKSISLYFKYYSTFSYRVESTKLPYHEISKKFTKEEQLLQVSLKYTKCLNFRLIFSWISSCNAFWFEIRFDCQSVKLHKAAREGEWLSLKLR